MAHPVSRDLLRFLKPYPPTVRQTALALREWLWKHFPESNELLYDNYNAVVIGFAVSENASGAFCSVAVYAGYVNFGLLRGREIADPKKLLSGSGRQYRKMRVDRFDDFPKKDVLPLVRQAFENERLRWQEKLASGQTLTKSESTLKRRPHNK